MHILSFLANMHIANSKSMDGKVREYLLFLLVWFLFLNIYHGGGGVRERTSQKWLFLLMFRIPQGIKVYSVFRYTGEITG